ncbi:MAG: gamma-glutamyltransferase family protein [Planctomycetota bacterium]|nr:gamma-glutamyltransferase family protein [Planctomycetota bacterium]
MADFDWSLPYPSQRMPVLARNVVATSQPLAAQAGLRMLQQGGNAVDAAVAAAIALTVVEPTSNGIGSDAFALVWAGGGLHGLNASGRSPKNLTSDRFQGMAEMPQLGWDPVTVPGAVSAWVELSQRFGGLPFEKLFEPAIQYARRGFLVSPQTAYYWSRGHERYKEFEPYQRTFCPDGRAPRPGELFKSPDHAATLQSIAETNGEAFYRGDLADRMAADAKAGGGLLTLDDLASHRPEWVRPIRIEYRGYSLHEIPPNGQGLTALLALGILVHHSFENLPVDSAETLHLQIEAMKLAFADAYRYIADPASMEVGVKRLLDPQYLAQRASLIEPDRAQEVKYGTPKPGGTVYLTAADAEGSMVSYIQSNYTGFGSGIVIPGTGIAMQNRGACFTLEAGHPNQVGPGKRPYHTIIPGFVTREAASGEHKPLMSFGVMGGFMQPQGHAQVMIRLADYGQNPQAALDAPRWRIDGGLKVSVEPGFDPAVYDGLRGRGHDVTIADARTVAHGGGQVIYKLADGYFGASDLRRDGQAVGY